MKNTPRKNIFTRKARDDSRFLLYLSIRAGWVALSMFFVGWVSLASIFRGSDTWSEKMHVFHNMNIPSSSSSSSSDGDIKGFFLLQDLISSTFVLSLITQSVTLLQRGIGLLNFPTINTHFIYYMSIIIMIIIHGTYLGIRAYLRNDLDKSYNYQDLDWIVWFFIFLFPLLGVLIGIRVNVDDDWHYRRHLQFLRLEFDTKLGMHSPR
jgi:small basic protein